MYTILDTNHKNLPHQNGCLIHFRPATPFGYYASSAEPVQMPPSGASDRGLHCLISEITMENAVKIKTKTTNGLIQMIRMDKLTSQKRVNISGNQATKLV